MHIGILCGLCHLCNTKCYVAALRGFTCRPVTVKHSSILASHLSSTQVQGKPRFPWQTPPWMLPSPTRCAGPLLKAEAGTPAA